MLVQHSIHPKKERRRAKHPPALLQPFPPSKGVPERQRGRGMFVRLLGKLLGNRMNIPLRRSAFAARRCPPSKGELIARWQYGIFYRPESIH